MDRHHGWYVSTKPIWTGFILSVCLTLGAVFLSLADIFAKRVILLSIAFIQANIQLVLFMHLGVEEKPRWNLITFCLLAAMIVIIVVGSIWIMDHLNYNTMDMEH